MTYDEASRILHHGHDGKAPFGAAGARNRAAQMRAGALDVTAYRCILPGCGLWHLGHTPSETGVERMAEAIRVYHDGPERPVEVPKDGPKEDRRKPTVTREVPNAG